jgi:hypothetical protein
VTDEKMPEMTIHWDIPSDGTVSFTLDEAQYEATYVSDDMVEFAKVSGSSDERKLVPVTGSDAAVSIRPMLYREPCLLKFEKKIELLPREKVTFYSYLPLHWEVVLSSAANEVVLDCIIDSSMAKSFHGAVTDGTVCNLQHTPVYSDSDLMPAEPNKAILPLQVGNRDLVPHEITKLLVRKIDLGLFMWEGRIYTNNVRITLLTNQQIDVVYSDRTMKKKADVLVPVKEHETSHTLLGLLPGITRRKIARYYGL